MVVIAAGREKHAPVGARLHLEAQQAFVERQRALRIGDVQMHVPDDDARIDHGVMRAPALPRAYAWPTGAASGRPTACTARSSAPTSRTAPVSAEVAIAA